MYIIFQLTFSISISCFRNSAGRLTRPGNNPRFVWLQGMTEVDQFLLGGFANKALYPVSEHSTCTLHVR